MARNPFVAGNWKMNTDKASAVALARAVAAGLPDGNVQVGAAVPFPYLLAAAEVAGDRLMIGAQDVFPQPNGAFTGEVSIEMLKDCGVKFVIVGHSERRHVIGEASEFVAEKAAAVYNAGLILVHCVGETLEQRDAGQTLAVVESQLAELSPAIEDASRLVIAYEPVWAIGTGRTATDEQAQEVHAFIRQDLAESFSSDFAEAVRIQYGGSMKPENARGLMAQKDVDGGLIGGAALKAQSFLDIINAAR